MRLVEGRRVVRKFAVPVPRPEEALVEEPAPMLAEAPIAVATIASEVPEPSPDSSAPVAAPPPE
jgi:hypothetical protein